MMGDWWGGQSAHVVVFVIVPPGPIRSCCIFCGRAPARLNGQPGRSVVGPGWRQLGVSNCSLVTVTAVQVHAPSFNLRRTVAVPASMAATNKYLAQTNKFGERGRATKKPGPAISLVHSGDSLLRPHLRRRLLQASRIAIAMAATNKCLAQMNKSRTAAKRLRNRTAAESPYGE
jgi:hypothetical protein